MKPNIKLMKKINQGRKLFEDLEVKKSGTNKFHKYNYYELDDLLPPNIFLCNELNIFTREDCCNETCYSLEVTDLDQGEEQEPVMFYAQACAVNNGNVTQGQQEKGSVLTYARRSLYLQLWSASDGNPIDAGKTNLTTKIEVDEDRVKELAKDLGRKVYENGGNNMDKKQLKTQLDKEFKAKNITSQEFEALKKMIEGMK